MATQDNSDFLTAFAIGTALGVGATLLLRPSRPNPRKQLEKRLKPHARKLRKAARKRPASARAAALAAAGRTFAAEVPRPQPGMDDAIAAGRELLQEFRGEVQRILQEARDELRAMAAEPHGGPAPAADLGQDV